MRESLGGKSTRSASRDSRRSIPPRGNSPARGYARPCARGATRAGEENARELFRLAPKAYLPYPDAVPKALTREQLEGRKEKAVRFVRDVLGDPDRADEIADESLEDYAERRHITLLNPRCRTAMPSKAELTQRIRELEEENDDLQDQLDRVADIVAPPEDEDEGDEDDDSGED